MSYEDMSMPQLMAEKREIDRVIRDRKTAKITYGDVEIRTTNGRFFLRFKNTQGYRERYVSLSSDATKAGIAEIAKKIAKDLEGIADMIEQRKDA
ncbi:MAG: hypothetical protein IJH05_05915 [Firmicutes bacterium]|nr:hypothetical protein [Bacillota bacterium]